MLETPKSAKTPSTIGIPNSCTTSAIFENAACTSVTLLRSSTPKFAANRSRASSNACTSRSRLINLPVVNLPAMAAEWPPAPSVAST